MMRWLGRMVFVALFVAALFVGVSWIAAERLTRARRVPVGAPPSDFPYPVESVQFTTADDETLSGWFVPAENATRGIVLLHGYAGTRKQMLPRAQLFRKAGYSVLLYDARSCGESTGNAITFGYRERQDIIAAVRLLRDRGCTDIACLGVSQGGATILFAAEDLPDVKCVICESVYDEMTHALDGRLRHYTGIPASLGACLLVPFAEHWLGLAIDDVKPIDHIAKLRCPVFVVSGAQDPKTSSADTERLFEAAREPKEIWMVPDAAHVDLFRFAGYEAKIGDFFKRNLP